MTTQPEKAIGTGPVGQGDYVVKDGDSIESIAFDKGYFWETLWNHPENAELKEIRKDRNILLPGDLLTLPPKKTKEETGETGQRHRYVLKGVPAHIRIEVLSGGEPRAKQSYTLKIDDQTFEGITDSKGVLEHAIPPNAKRGRLVIGPESEEYELRLGVLDPISEIKGVQQRLLNMGYACGEADGTLTPETTRAIRAFQEKRELNETGKPDEGTRAKLEEVHDQRK